MIEKIVKIGFGGGCHWCTEAVFQTLKGVTDVKQGYISSIEPNESFSEGVLVYYNPSIILLSDLIHIHLNTHESTKNHSFRKQYRSAMYYFNDSDIATFNTTIAIAQQNSHKTIITQALLFNNFKESRISIQNYYIKRPDAPFCKRYIVPKLKKLETNFKHNL